MAEEESSGERTEVATQRHADKAREAGNVAVSREVAIFAAIAAATLVLRFYVPWTVGDAMAALRAFLARADDTRLVKSGLYLAVTDSVPIIVPLLAAAAIAGAAAVLAQTRLLFHFGALEPKISRVNPFEGIKRLFGVRGLGEAAKALAKLIILGLAIWFCVRSALPLLLMMPLQDPRSLLQTVGWQVSEVLMTGLYVHVGFAAADFGWVTFKHARDLRMTKQDVRDEHKETEGNPHTKARVRRIRAVRARQRMMDKVPKATVVVTNPTHYAVALAYDRAANPAPRLVAKGVDEVAARIRDLARKHHVPIVANPVLARALFTVQLDAEIPAEHYRAVAEIIAYVWRLKLPSAASPSQG